MSTENPGAYNEARNRIREKQEEERAIVEKKKEDFEVGKERVYRKKKLDVFELKHHIETGRSLESLKNDVRSALDQWQISVDAYRKAIHTLDAEQEKMDHEKKQRAIPEFIFDPSIFPFQKTYLAQYFEEQPLWKNPLIDIGGFLYWVAQGSLFLFYIAWKIVFDLLLLPIDIYHSLKK
mgnify:CR=1 FL=1